MNEPIFVLNSEVNKRNRARCEVFEDRVVLTTECTGGFMPVYDNAEREILFSEIEEVIISKGGIKLFAHHPNCIHFKVHGASRTVDSMYRDRSFRASDYIDEGVFQLAPKSEAELEQKLDTAKEIKRYIENAIHPDDAKNQS